MDDGTGLTLRLVLGTLPLAYMIYIYVQRRFDYQAFYHSQIQAKIL